MSYETIVVEKKNKNLNFLQVTLMKNYSLSFEYHHLNNLLTQEDLSAFKGMVGELRDTWTKKQMFRTETEARFSVLQDNRYPTKAAKYWQCVREQSTYLDNLMALSFDYRRNDAKIIDGLNIK